MNTRLHINLIRILLTTGIAGIGLMLISAVKTKDSKPCSGIKVRYTNGNAAGFLPESAVMNLIVQQLQVEPKGTPLEKFDLRAIEDVLESHPWVYNAQLYFDNRQTLHVMIDEAVPVARIIDTGGRHFYLDRLVNELPLSTSCRVDLPVFTGIPVKRNTSAALSILQRVVSVGEVIARDSFWLAQAAQIDVLPNGKMELIPAFGSHTVDLGYAEKPALMFERLKHFYIAAGAAGKLHRYSRLLACYEKQIIARHSPGIEPEKVQKTEAMATYQKMVEQNKQSVDANSITTNNAAGRFVTETPSVTGKAGAEKSAVQKETKTGEAGNKKVETTPAEEKPVPKNEATTEPVKPKAIMPKLEKN